MGRPCNELAWIWGRRPSAWRRRLVPLGPARFTPRPSSPRLRGEPGELGRNAIRRNDGRIEIRPGCAETDVEAGEAIEIVTPTGGGWGAVE